MVGPMDFTTNDEIGVLIAGHEHRPIILCPWHHPYYQRLLEQDADMEKAMDLYMWSLHVTERGHVHPAIWQAADRLESEHGIVCRNFRKQDLSLVCGDDGFELHLDSRGETDQVAFGVDEMADDESCRGLLRPHPPCPTKALGLL
jgi:hypothetical protein